MYIFSTHLIVQGQLIQFANSSFFCFSPLHSPLPISRWVKKNFFTGYKVKV